MRYFTWVFPIPKNLTFPSWRGQFWCQRFWWSYCYIHTWVYQTFHDNAVYSYFWVWSLFIYRSLPKYSMIYPGFFVIFSVAILLFETVWYLTIDMVFFNCSGKEFPLRWQETLNQTWHRGLQEASHGVLQWQRITSHLFINPLPAFYILSA